MALILKFNLTFAVTDKKINKKYKIQKKKKEKEIQNKYNFFVHGWAKKDPL